MAILAYCHQGQIYISCLLGRSGGLMVIMLDDAHEQHDLIY